MMTRVIQDSDDEFEEEEDDIDGPIEIPIDAPTKQDASNVQPQSGEHGTGSTNSLKKAFEAAHHAHFQSQFEPSMPSAPPNAHEDDLISHRGNKRRRISTEAVPKMPGPTLGSPTSNPLNSYREFKSVFSSPFLEQEEGVTRQEVSEGNTWQLQGAMREDYVHHNPISMFSEPSSTIPNTTLTQQRLLEEVMAPAFLGLEPEAEPNRPHYEPQASVPWSDFLKSPSENTQPHSDHANPTEQSSTHSNIEPSALSNESRRPANPPTVLSQSQGRSQHRRSSGQLKVSPGGDDLDDGNFTSTAKIVLEQDVGVKLHTPSTASEVPAGKKPDPSPSTKGKRKSSPVPTSDDFLEAIRLPQEQYKPRPTRSRSARTVVEEPTDYSVIPEKAATRRTARRSKTSNAVVTATPRRIQQICDMGFTPNTTQRGLEKNNGDIAQTIEWLVSNVAVNDDRDELAPPSPIKTKSRTPKTSVKQVSEEQPRGCPIDVQPDASILNEADDACVPMNDNANVQPASKAMETPPQKSPRVQVVVSKPGGNAQVSNNDGPVDPTSGAPRTKPKRRKTTLDQPESTLEEIAPQPAKETKRGRGRRKKEPPAPVPNKIIPKDCQESGSEVEEDKQSVTGVIFKEIQSNTASPPTNEPTHLTPPAKIPQITAEAQKTKTTDSVQSAAGSVGKVAYRVGLSKRTRIAPLLKIMKK